MRFRGLVPSNPPPRRCNAAIHACCNSRFGTTTGLHVGAVFKPSLYYYYPTKEAVFRSVIRREQDVFLAELAVIEARTAGACEKLRAYGALRVELTERLMNLNRINRLQHEDIKSIFHDVFAEFDVHEQHCLVRILRAGTASGEFACPQVKPTAAMIQHVMQGLRLRLFRTGTQTADSARANREWRSESRLFIETALQGIMNTQHDTRL